MFRMVLFIVKRNYFILNMSILYLVSTAATTLTYSCAATCSGTFNAAGSTSCSQICYDDTATCNSTSTVCPGVALGSALYYFTINGYYCNSAYSNFIYPGGVTPGYGPCGAGSCCIYDFNLGNLAAIYAAFGVAPGNYSFNPNGASGDYYCITIPCVNGGG